MALLINILKTFSGFLLIILILFTINYPSEYSNVKGDDFTKDIFFEDTISKKNYHAIGTFYNLTCLGKGTIFKLNTITTRSSYDILKVCEPFFKGDEDE